MLLVRGIALSLVVSMYVFVLFCKPILCSVNRSLSHELHATNAAVTKDIL